MASGDDNGSPSGRQPDGGLAGQWTLWLVVGAVGAHIIEEYALNFDGWALQALHAPVTAQDFHLVNAGVIVYGIACACVGWRAPWFSLSSAAMVVLNAIAFHFGASVITGMYSPGTVTAVLLFVPAGVLAYRAAWRAGVLSTTALVASAGIGVAWHVFLGTVFYLKYFRPLYP